MTDEQKLTLGHARGLVGIVNDAYAEMARNQLERGLILFEKMPKPTPEQIEERKQRSRDRARRAEQFLAELQGLCGKYGMSLRAVGEDAEIELFDRAALETLAYVEEVPGTWRIA